MVSTPVYILFLQISKKVWSDQETITTNQKLWGKKYIFVSKNLSAEFQEGILFYLPIWRRDCNSVCSKVIYSKNHIEHSFILLIFISFHFILIYIPTHFNFKIKKSSGYYYFRINGRITNGFRIPRSLPRYLVTL